MEMNNLIKEYRRYKRIADEAKAELDKLKPQIIAEMHGENTVIGDDYKVMYKSVRSARIDAAMLRREYPEIAEKVTKEVESNRLTVN
jgi:predicted phage-related endonuclease